MLLSCEDSTNKSDLPNFQERELSFLHLRFGYDKSNNWIKQPANILMLHETFKKIGYGNLINNEDLISDWNWFLDVNKSPQSLIDSLETTYSNVKDAPTYYRQFWERRIAEKNDEIVYQVVKEIKQILIEQDNVSFDQSFVNDTLEQLISAEYPERTLTNQEANTLLAYVIKIGLHKSAYNLVSGEHWDIWIEEWDKIEEETLKLLQESESESNERPWFEDNTK